MGGVNARRDLQMGAGRNATIVAAVTGKLLLVVVLQFLTTPVAAHMVGRAAYRSGGLMSDLTIMDELGRDSPAEIDGPSQ
jgi:multisubunit Na+/H+ antiporter MnhG subunit